MVCLGAWAKLRSRWRLWEEDNVLGRNGEHEEMAKGIGEKEAGGVLFLHLVGKGLI